MNAGRFLLGSMLTALGVVFVLGSADVLDPGETIAGWWPVAIVALGLFYIAETGRFGGGAAALVVIGVALVGVTSGLFGSDAWAYVWPTALVLLGLWIMFGWARARGSRPTEDDEVDGIAVLGSSRLSTRSQSFRRASLTALLGGVTLDLTEALPVPGGASVFVTSVLGGVAILVPRGWLVEISGIPLIGGWDDTTDRTAVGSGAPRLEIQALVALGGVEVKHSGRWR